MTTREKIIVGIMCLTIAYGAYNLLNGVSPKHKPSATQPDSKEDLPKFVTEMTQKIVDEQIGEPYRNLIAQAGAPWTKDPFIQSAAPLKSQLTPPVVNQQQRKPATEFPDLIFSGFLQVGDSKLAVINGMEYTVGEAMGASGYFLKNISSQQVVIGKVDGSETIRLPLQEIDFGATRPTP